MSITFYVSDKFVATSGKDLKDQLCVVGRWRRAAPWLLWIYRSITLIFLFSVLGGGTSRVGRMSTAWSPPRSPPLPTSYVHMLIILIQGRPHDFWLGGITINFRIFWLNSPKICFFARRQLLVRGWRILPVFCRHLVIAYFHIYASPRSRFCILLKRMCAFSL